MRAVVGLRMDVGQQRAPKQNRPRNARPASSWPARDRTPAGKAELAPYWGNEWFDTPYEQSPVECFEAAGPTGLPDYRNDR